jgi:hypothetical protein
MKIELKNIKYFAANSDETWCFHATVYIDGVKACTVSNQGHGGGHLWSDWKVCKRLNEYGKTLPPNVSDLDDPNDPSKKLSFPQDAESLVNDVMATWLYTQDLKKTMRKHVLYEMADGNLYQSKKLDAATLLRWLAMPDLAAKLKATKILNTMPFDEALALFRHHNQ